MYKYRLEYGSGVGDDDDDFISDPPMIYIVGPDSFDILEVLIDPTPAVDKPSDLDEHWIVPEFVGQLLDKLNKE